MANLRTKISNALTVGVIGLVAIIPPLMLGRRIYHSQTADITANADWGQHGKDMRTLYGYRNKHGQIKRIIEYSPVVGPKWATSSCSIYTPEDEEFERLKKVLLRG